MKKKKKYTDYCSDQVKHGRLLLLLFVSRYVWKKKHVTRVRGDQIPCLNEIE